MKKAPFLLCILDGVGLNPSTHGNAVAAAHTPTLDELMNSYPYTTLTTHGEAVGLPEGQMGNSEVGHLNIGAGRIVKQWLLKIKDEFQKSKVETAPVVQTLAENINTTRGNLHLIGLCSFGGVHSHLDHLLQLIPILSQKLPDSKIILHLIADGRDVPPQQFIHDLSALEEVIQTHTPQVIVGSLSGRYYAMDRDSRWERTEAAYHAITEAGQERSQEEMFQCLRMYIEKSYENGTFDEFLVPLKVAGPAMSSNDGVIFWNFRSDRMRQIVRAITEESFPEFPRVESPPPQEHVLCFAEYDQKFSLPVLFPPEHTTDHLGETLARAGVSQLRIAETEKYPHVTYFLNGGDESISAGEDRILIPSPRDVKTYDEKPEMSASEVTRRVIEDIDAERHSCIILNFANGDMVGHTGVFDAAVHAIETVDHSLGEILNALEKKNGTALIIADHGNAEQMIDPTTGAPHTAHTTFPVPAILFDQQLRTRRLRSGGALCDIAPTILDILSIPVPSAMTGRSLLDA